MHAGGSVDAPLSWISNGKKENLDLNLKKKNQLQQAYTLLDH